MEKNVHNRFMQFNVHREVHVTHHAHARYSLLSKTSEVHRSVREELFEVDVAQVRNWCHLEVEWFGISGDRVEPLDELVFKACRVHLADDSCDALLTSFDHQYFVRVLLLGPVIP